MPTDKYVGPGKGEIPSFAGTETFYNHNGSDYFAYVFFEGGKTLEEYQEAIGAIANDFSAWLENKFEYSDFSVSRVPGKGRYGTEDFSVKGKRWRKEVEILVKGHNRAGVEGHPDRIKFLASPEGGALPKNSHFERAFGEYVTALSRARELALK